MHFQKRKKEEIAQVLIPSRRIPEIITDIQSHTGLRCIPCPDKPHWRRPWMLLSPTGIPLQVIYLSNDERFIVSRESFKLEDVTEMLTGARPKNPV